MSPRTLCFVVVASVAVAVNALVACGPIRNCGDWRRRDPDGAICRECVDHGARYAECGLTTERRPHGL